MLTTRLDFRPPSGYCYHLVNILTYGLTQSDHIKWLNKINFRNVFHFIDKVKKRCFKLSISQEWQTFLKNNLKKVQIVAK